MGMNDEGGNEAPRTPENRLRKYLENTGSGQSNNSAENLHGSGEQPGLGATEEPEDNVSVESAEAPAMFEASTEGLVWNKPHGSAVLLTNFIAIITHEFVTAASGARLFAVAARRQGQDGETLTESALVSSSDFAKMAWVSEQLGAGWVILPGMKDRARAAIQMISGTPEVLPLVASTGWSQMPDKTWAFAHGGGGIGPSEELGFFDLSAALVRFTLPAPPENEAAINAVRASFKLLDLAPARVVFPIFCAIWRSVLGACDFSVFLAGTTGAMKSSLAALAQQHFGKGMDASHLPASWSSTENALESMAHAAKDVLLVIDDFAPTGSRADVLALHKKAERVLRAQGNGSGRQRLRSNLSLAAGSAPRGLILATGEDTPKGQSLRARMFVTDVAPGEIDVEKLTACQADASAGVYAAAMAGFLAWLAPQFDAIQAKLPDNIAQVRSQVTGSHARTATTVANLMAGFAYFMNFAIEAGAISKDEANRLGERCLAALVEVAANQEEGQFENDPTQLFLSALSTAISSGAAHVASAQGKEPENARLLGWTGNGSLAPNGKRIGWVNGADLYLDPQVAFLVANRVVSKENAIPIPLTTLKKRLFERDLLVSTETRGGKRNLVIRKHLEGSQRVVLHIRVESVVESLDTTGDEDQGLAA